MNQTKRLLSDFEKLTILNRICKVQHVSNPYRTNYHHYSKSPLRNNPQTLYLQKTNPSFMPQKVKLIKKQREINSLSPNSFRNSRRSSCVYKPFSIIPLTEETKLGTPEIFPYLSVPASLLVNPVTK